MIYDLIIIGGGPAGSAAAVYASRKRLNTLFITSEWGGQSSVSEKIFNWIGSTSISGTELAESMKRHVLANAGVGQTLQIKEGEKVTSIIKKIDTFKIKTDTEEFETKTILIATGSVHRKLEAKNADKFENKGLTYCATCDGPMFSGMDVAVIGGGNAAFESAAQLLAYCNSVTLLNRSNFRADQVTIDKVLKNRKIKSFTNADISEIKGDKFVEEIIIKDKNTNQEKEIKVSGIFVEIGQIPNTDFLKDLIPLDKTNRIKIDPWTGKTEVANIWAAGDCTNVLYHQNNIAAGDAIRSLEDIYSTIHTK